MAVPFRPPHMNANPQMKNPSMPRPYTAKFMDMVCPAFLARMRPVSTSAKPACMNMTRKPATSVQTKLDEYRPCEADCATASTATARSFVVAFAGSGLV